MLTAVGNQLPTAELLGHLEVTLLEMDSVTVERGGSPQAWNRLTDRAQSLQLVLRETPPRRADLAGVSAEGVVAHLLC